MNRPLILAVDFDGTCVTADFPAVGKNIGAAPVLRLLRKYGCKLILYTMRGNIRQDYQGHSLPSIPLQDALNWSEVNNVTWDAINEPILPQDWTDSPKIFADYYLDDMALSAPLLRVSNVNVYNWLYVISTFMDILNFSSEDLLLTLKEVSEELNALRIVKR